ncbi:MAG: DUF1707 domain-containing protein [Acidimicrobiia bacterium]|nr:DUF1707 domain-containing protein [Acidimicrobiia bacterium]
MSIEPTPRPQPPADVPSDEDRRAVVATIQQALADDQVSFDEIDERFRRVFAARTQAELRAVVADLPELRRSPPPPDARHLAARSSFKLLGDTKVGGWLTLDGDLTAINVIGDTVIDLSSAAIPDRGVTVAAWSLIGDVKVIVPDGVRVQSQVISLIGDRTERLTPPQPGAPTVRVRVQLAVGDSGVYSLSEVPIGRLRRLWTALRRSGDDQVEDL